jgi:hypothetical protein
MRKPSSLEKLHWIMAEQRRGPEAWRAALLAAIDRIFAQWEMTDAEDNDQNRRRINTEQNSA